MSRGTKLAVTKDPEDEIAVEVMERSILEISAAMKRINASRLSRRAIVALIKDNSGIPKTTIELVLNNLDALESNYLKK